MLFAPIVKQPGHSICGHYDIKYLPVEVFGLKLLFFDNPLLVSVLFLSLPCL